MQASKIHRFNKATGKMEPRIRVINGDTAYEAAVDHGITADQMNAAVDDLAKMLGSA